MRLGLFDSGVGGLTVLKSIKEHHLFDEIIYYGDTARVPYGTKDKNTIIRYALEAVEFLKNFEVDMVVAACNSVSAYAIEEIREHINIPVLGVIEPGVKALMKKEAKPNDHILILGTTATIKSQKYERLLQANGFSNITALATPLFVPLVEEGIFEGDILDSTMRHYFKDIKKPHFIILGCTHFPLLKDSIQSYFPNSTLIHSGEAIVEHLQSNFDIVESSTPPILKLFASSDPDGLKRVAKLWLP